MQDRVSETSAIGLAGTDDGGILHAFGANADDAVALAAYALHRRARLDFEARFAAKHGREPDDAERDAFLLGEVTKVRIAAYRAEAERLMKPGVSPKPPRKARWPFFGLWVDAPMGPSPISESLNWRGLFIRLVVLLLAVIVTAILLRVLFVQR
ncbi:MAG TPA: hypothetical protein PKW21_08345 [Rhabdaerophilum sp.]|nr:hypothetical protein [Rhabdaerophilum sp.]